MMLSATYYVFHLLVAKRYASIGHCYTARYELMHYVQQNNRKKHLPSSYTGVYVCVTKLFFSLSLAIPLRIVVQVFLSLPCPQKIAVLQQGRSRTALLMPGLTPLTCCRCEKDRPWKHTTHTVIGYWFQRLGGSICEAIWACAAAKVGRPCRPRPALRRSIRWFMEFVNKDSFDLERLMYLSSYQSYVKIGN